VWTGGPVKGGSIQRFTMRIGPLSMNANRVVFTARQVYASGHVARWDDNPSTIPAPSPSPVLVVSRHAPGRSPVTPDGVDTPFNQSENRAIDSRVQSLVRRGQVATPDDVQAGRWISLVSLFVSAGALVVAVLAFLNSRRGAPSASEAAPGNEAAKGASIAG
jgi:hypothetical protein